MITSGRLCSSTESLGVITPTARQMADSSAWAIFIASSFGFSRFSRAQSCRFLNSPSMIVKTSSRNCPVPALLGFISEAVITARYFPAGIGIDRGRGFHLVRVKAT